MDRLVSPIEKRIDATCDKLFGDDTQLACAYKMAAMNATEAELTQAIYVMKSMNAEMAAEINADMQYTLDASGNVVELYPRFEPIEDTKIETSH